MNETCEFHFIMNEEYYAELGVHEPWAYSEGFLAW